VRVDDGNFEDVFREVSPFPLEDARDDKNPRRFMGAFYPTVEEMTEGLSCNFRRGIPDREFLENPVSIP
jgi:hypothetical protein